MTGSETTRSTGVAWWEAALMIRGQTAADQRNIKVMTLWCAVWAVVFVGVTFVLRSPLGVSGPLAWLLALVPIVIGVFVIRALLRFLREADEFTRKVQLEGIALGSGAGYLFCIGYHQLEQFGAPPISMIYAIVPMGFGWAIGSLLVASRYR